MGALVIVMSYVNGGRSRMRTRYRWEDNIEMDNREISMAVDYGRMLVQAGIFLAATIFRPALGSSHFSSWWLLGPLFLGVSKWACS